MPNDGSHKTIVFSFEGTGNEPEDVTAFVENESITNVLKLHLLMGGGLGRDGAVVGSGQEMQRAFYYNGVGTRDAGLALIPT